MTSQMLDIKATAAAFGVHPSRVKAWMTMGCPSGHLPPRGNKGGRKRGGFDIVSVKQWLMGQGIVPKRIPITQADIEPEPGPSSDDQVINRLGAEGMVERLRQAERLIFAKWARELRKTEPDSMLVKAYSIEHGRTGEFLRKAEKDLPGILLKSRTLIRADEAAAELADIAGEIRTHLLALPAAAAAAVAGKPANEAQAVLDSEIRQALGRLSRAIEKGGAA